MQSRRIKVSLGGHRMEYCRRISKHDRTIKKVKDFFAKTNNTPATVSTVSRATGEERSSVEKLLKDRLIFKTEQLDSRNEDFYSLQKIFFHKK